MPHYRGARSAESLLRRGREGTQEFAQKGPTLAWLRRQRSYWSSAARAGVPGARIAARNVTRAIQLVRGVKRIPAGVADFLSATGGR